MARTSTAKTTTKKSTAKRPRSTSGARHLVVVESPAKATTVGRFLGSDYVVRASMGHVRDLPEGKLGVDTDSGFDAQYQVMKDKRTIVADLKKAGETAEDVYLATDPDREGEAISWHVLQAAGWKDKPIKRVVFHSITPEAVKEAFDNERDIDMRLVNAQQARRILDRLVGYQLSPLLWRKVQRGLSAGRVQSVALRLVVDRDREIDAFTPVEYWSIEAALKTDRASFTANLQRVEGEKQRISLPDKASVDRIVSDLEGSAYQVGALNRREVKRRPSAPFITSTLQQEAWRQLRFSARKTMMLAQQLYEGIDLGGSEGTVGLITYMRTDSPQVAPVAIEEARTYIEGRWGKQYLPPSARRYSSRSKVAQEAHEAIRPTGISRDPERVKNRLSQDQLRLYELVWKRMVSSQMSDAILDSTQVDVTARGRSGTVFVFRASGSVVKFPGFRVLYIEARDESAKAEESDDEGAEENTDRVLPDLREGQALDCNGLESDQHFTEPPPRYTEASLIKALEERGIGRPSTYAPIISTIVDRQYVSRERGALKSTKLGQVVCEQLTGYFQDIMDLDFTAKLEEQLDEVANGNQEWVPLLKDFYTDFSKALEDAQENMPRKPVEEETDEVCEVCGRPMVIKHGRFGPFMSCTGFPECKNSKPIQKKTGANCPVCGGDLLERKGKGRTFFGCSNYPTCNFTVSRKPLPQPCPECEGLIVVSGRNNAACTNCAWRGPVPEEEPAGVA